ncbi:MAG: hypothetical protein PUD23_03290 [Prevotella sp.]|nr:hypothetical protein [Prevotella sp.]
MKSVLNILRLEAGLSVLISLCFVVLYENDVLFVGQWGADRIADYYWAIFMEAATICLIPLSLRLFKWKHVEAAIHSDGDQAMLRWGTLRLAMLCVPMVLNTWLYYQFMNVAFGYMAIIGLLSLAFVYPTRTRYIQEKK